MKLKTLQQRHPMCDVRLYQRYQALYQGGRLFRDMVGCFLPKNPTDTPEMYAMRKRDASYRSYVGPIVDFYATQLFSAPYAIRAMRGETQAPLDPYYASLKEDVDGMGTDLTSFFRGRFVQSLVKGTAYWVCEFPRDDGPPPETRTDWLSRGLDQAKLCPLDAECIHDWECDPETGDYAWLKTYSSRFYRASPASDVMCIQTWTIYTPETVHVYELGHPKGRQVSAEMEVPLIDTYAHGFPRVPILCLQMPEGLWLLDRASDAQVEHFCLSASLGWALRRSAYAMGIFKIRDINQKPKMDAGVGIFLGSEEDFSWAEPSGSSFSILREEISSQKDEIYRVSQQMAMSIDNNSASLGRSGLSKMADSAAQEICLRGYATIVKEAMEKTFEFVSDARGDVDTKFSIEGMNQFHVADAGMLIENAASAKTLGIKSHTLYKEIDKRVAEALLPTDTSQKVKDQIREEIETAPQEDDPVSTPTPGMEQANGPEEDRTSSPSTPPGDQEE